MTTAAIILPPARLGVYSDRMGEDYAAVYAINAATLRYKSTYACVADKASFDPLLRSGLHSRILTRTGLRSSGGLSLYGAKPTLLDRLGIANDGPECKYTTPCAVYHAATNYDSIDLYGLDCSTDGSHPLARWLNELPWMAYALSHARKWTARGEIRKDWLIWLRRPSGQLTR